MKISKKIQNVLVIGASSGIAQACIKQLLSCETIKSVVTVSRQEFSVQGVSLQKTSQQKTSQQKTSHKDALLDHQKLHSHTVTGYSDLTISRMCQDLQDNSLDLVISTIGVLHENQSLSPEKKIEDITSETLQRYFEINSVIPTLWLKHLITKVKKDNSNIVMLSARVGSISDNQLGGWYGYRASKAALNMLVKTAQVEYQRRSPGCDLVLYHPGTVDTPLSKPFQRNVKPEKLFTPEFTALQLFELLNNKPDYPPPYYLDWQHRTISW